MIIYGKTWWGKKWLETFNGIDEENRLGRGRSYANTGRAYDIKVKGSSVTARVRGSRPAPYKVKINFQVFNHAVQDKIRKIISDSPLILSMLLNKKLPLQIVQKLDQANIKLFPASWRDIDASCSCPDWAMPCKHIASVIYLICNQIDQNPFLLFEVHDCNLFNLIDDYREGRIAEVQKIIGAEELITGFKDIEADKFDSAKLSEIDLSKIPDLLPCIITILSDNPPFCDKNFRGILSAAYKHWQTNPLGYKKWRAFSPEVTDARKITREASEEEIFLARWNYPEKLNNFDFVINDHHAVVAIGDEATNINVFNGTKDIILDLITFLEELPNSLLHKVCPKIRFVHMLYQYSVILLEKSAVIPQILQSKKGVSFIRWIPALFEGNVKSIYSQLCDICPKNIVTYNESPLPMQEQIKIIVSTIISGLIHSNLPAALSKNQATDIFRLFFYGERLLFKDFRNTEIPSSINSWLGNLYLSQKQHKVYLKIEENKEGFTLTPQILLPGTEFPVKVKEAIASTEAKLKLDILSDLSVIFEYLPSFDELINEDSNIIFTLEDFAPLFLNIMPALQAIGVVVILPKSLHKIFKPQLNLELKSKAKIKDDRASFLSLNNLLDFNWQIAIGDNLISIEEFKKLLKVSGNLVKLMDSYVLLDEKEIALLLKQIEKLPDSLTSEELMQAMLAQELNGAGISLDDQLKSLIENISKYQKVSIPHNLKADLRPYQERGVNWLIQNIHAGFGSILADDMGLGKTLQVIATILYLRNNGFLENGNRVIVVAPTTLLSNWQREFEKFAPDIITGIYHGNKRELLTDCDVIITTYGLARSDRKELNKLKWFLLVIDEAQAIKNPFAEQTKAIKSIEAEHKIAMSGTPVENRLLEYWSIFDFTNKMYLGSLKQFKDRYASPIEKERNKDCLQRFKRVTAPFILRRLKSDKTIIADLPDKIENNRYCLLTSEQTALYQKVVDASIKKIENSEGIERKGLVLQLINSLKQICNHPSQFVKKQANITTAQSGKMLMLEEILAEIDNIGEKCLIFTQYREMGDILVKLIEREMNIRLPFLHGGISRGKRDEMVDDFQNASTNTRIFIISLKAGGTGLNLTAANHVIHYDLWWNPAVENQATDRAYRIGQRRNVIVHRFITTGTFEERIDEMIRSKKELASLAVNDGENWITEMTTDEIKNLVKLNLTL